MRIHADPDPDPGQTVKSQKVECLHKKILQVGNRSKNIPTKIRRYTKAFLIGRNQGYLLILVNFDAPGSESGSAFPIRIRILDSQN
jgi:hypothetical protein